MKTTFLVSTALACVLLAVHPLAASAVVDDWNAALVTARKSSQQNAGGRVRVDAILRSALDAAMSGLKADAQIGRNAEPLPAGASLDAATAQAAFSTMSVLYPRSRAALDSRLADSLARIIDGAPAIAAGRKWGEHVAQVILAEQRDAVVLNSYSFAEEVQAPASLSSGPAVPAEPHAEQAAIGPGRYRFSALAGASGSKGYVDGVGAAARFENPGAIVADAAGNVYVSERSSSTIRKVSPTGVVTTLAGTAGQIGSTDGAGSAARFNQPLGLAVDGAGNVYVADSGNYTIRKIDAAGNVTTVAGTAGASGSTDGPRNSARFSGPAWIAAGSAGSLLVSDGALIRRIAPDGTVASLPAPKYDSYTGTPKQIAVDREDNVYVIARIPDFDGWGPFDLLVNMAPNVETGQYTSSTFDPAGGWSDPVSIATDETGRLFVRAWEASFRYVYAPDTGWQVRYPAGASGADWFMTHEGELDAVGKSGKLFVIAEGAIEAGEFDPEAAGPVIIWQPYWDIPTGEHPKAADVGKPATFHVYALGGVGLSYQWYFNSNPINGANSTSWKLGNVRKSDAGLYSVVVTDANGSLTSSQTQLVVTDPQPTPPPPPLEPTPAAASGGGSFDRGSALAALMLLVVAARRRHRDSPPTPARVVEGDLNSSR